MEKPLIGEVANSPEMLPVHSNIHISNINQYMHIYTYVCA